MKRDPRPAKWWLLLIPVLPLLMGEQGADAWYKKNTQAVGYRMNNCERYAFTVVCGKNKTQGGPTGCFDSLCDAAEAGAYQCRTNLSACEPH